MGPFQFGRGGRLSRQHDRINDEMPQADLELAAPCRAIVGTWYWIDS